MPGPACVRTDLSEEAQDAEVTVVAVAVTFAAVEFPSDG